MATSESTKLQIVNCVGEVDACNLPKSLKVKQSLLISSVYYWFSFGKHPSCFCTAIDAILYAVYGQIAASTDIENAEKARPY